MFALTNARIYDFENYIENGFVVFDEKIEMVGDMKTFRDKGYDITDCRGALVMPGLTVAHTHIYSTFSRGLALPFNPANFQELLDQLWWKIDSHLEKDDIYYSALTAAREYLLNGVTTVIDHHASGYIRGSLGLIKSAFEKAGLTGSLCFETSDRFDIDDCIAENLENGDMFGLHASMSLSDETLEKVKKVLGNRPIHIHAAESWLDQESCMDYHGMRVVQRLYDFGLLNKGSILSHCIHINEDEADLIAKNQCYVALNIQSNMNNAVGLPDVRMLKKHNVRCLIGNDGMSMGIASEWMSLLLAMKHKYSSPVAFGLGGLLELVNENYKYMNEYMGLKIGRIKEGYDADIIKVCYEPISPMDESNAFGHILFGLSGSLKPADVWKNGKRIVENCICSTVANEEIVKAVKTAGKLWDRLNRS
ncbi:MAG TPA: amidohydrolase family protein [Clostridia bacterium]|nr:amidohydrolase family protein [Clostridia bacterium]HRX41245.1 amidohydrolase family protein [Clostridia bacterium]